MNTALAYLMRILPMIQPVAQAIQALHSEASVATKTQLTTDALSVATASAAALLPPSDTTTVNLVSGSVASIIAAAVAAEHAIATPKS